ncbi:MAG: hypothetical protein LVQ96_04575 [Thermoplasmatales archaeon]|nr:hypothetical protein [Thermoplasmatales archaeon]MCW6170430.1 hypothetical protein [Thermoplasmatales archaeon]
MTKSFDSFSSSLGKKPLIFTALPLRDNRTGDPSHDQKIMANLESRKKDLADELKNFSRLNAVSVPELVEENHEGRPRYNSIYTRSLSRGTADLIGKDAIVNKVVAHMETYEMFVDWLSETYALGLKNMIFVGGNTRHHRFPGPSVSEANLIARHLNSLNRLEGMTIGNICLPERREEAKRMLFKTISGAQFFTTQILFDSSQMIGLLQEYSRLCRLADIAPSTVLLSFAPLRSSADLNLLDFLGVELPDKPRNYILESGDPSGAPKRSVINALKVYAEVITASYADGVLVPLGVNIEQLTRSNFKTSMLMLEEFNDAVDAEPDRISDMVISLDREE